MADDEKDISSRFAPVVVVVALLVAGSLFPKGLEATREPTKLARTKARAEKEHRRDRSEEAGIHVAVGFRAKAPRPEPAPVQLASDDGTPDLSAYEDLGSWIDIYDAWPWAHPTLAVRKLHERGVRTIFLQTSNWGADGAIFKPRQTARFLAAAHRRNMKVVAWYVPSFAKPKEDYYRSRDAILFKKGGHSFDSFGLDIESTVVGNIWRRNQRLLDLSKRLRDLVGKSYTLGAITPDPVKALYWPNFPYKRVNRLYDVFVPMGYFSFRTDGYLGVKRYTLASIRNIRRESGDPNVPIHLIGGIGGETQAPEVKGFVRAVRGNNVLGASYYDFAVTTEAEWKELEAIVQEPEPPAPEPAPTPEPTQAVAPDVKPGPIAGAEEPQVLEDKKRDGKKRGDRDEGRSKKRNSRDRDGKNDRDGSRRNRKGRNR